MNKEQILNITNFKDYSHNEMSRMIVELQQEVKSLRFNKDYQTENLQNMIRTLQSTIAHNTLEIEKLEKMTQFYLKMLDSRLTWKERFTGKKIIG